MNRAICVHCIRVHGMHSIEREISMKNITLSADESLIEAARSRAASEKTTLNNSSAAGLPTTRRRVIACSATNRLWKACAGR